MSDSIDWDALASQVQANFAATGRWFVGDLPSPLPPPPPAVDWNALAAEVQANFAATGQWFAGSTPTPTPTPTPVRTVGTPGDDTLSGTEGPDTILGDAEGEFVGGTAGADVIEGRGGADSLTGDADTLVGAQGGHDTIFGGDGSDTVFGDATALRTVPVVSGPPPLAAGGDDELHGGSGHDLIHGDAQNLNSMQAGADSIQGEAGSDTIYGDSERGPLRGSSSADTLDGGSGDDALYGDARLFDQRLLTVGAGDLVSGSAGDDLIYGDALSHAVLVELPVGAPGEWGLLDDFRPAGGPDTLSGGLGDDTIIGDLAINSDGFGSTDSITGDAGDDVLYGDGIDQYVVHMGNDTLEGGPGNDTLYGDAGRATYVATPSNPGGPSDGSAGNDFLHGGGGQDALYGDAAEMFLPASTSLRPGNALPPGRDTLDGGAGADSLFGGGGADVFVLRRGEIEGDILLDFSGLGGDADRIRLVGFGPGASLGSDLGTDNWFVRVNGVVQEHFTLQNGATLHNQDYVFRQPDTLIEGTEGDDILRESRNVDVISGGSGNDTFVYDIGSSWFPPPFNPNFQIVISSINSWIGEGERDRILDFQQGEDVIDLSGQNTFTIRHGPSGDTAFEFIGIQEFTGVQPQVRYEVQGDNTVVQMDGLSSDGTSFLIPLDGIVDAEIELAGMFALTADDFVL